MKNHLVAMLGLAFVLLGPAAFAQTSESPQPSPLPSAAPASSAAPAASAAPAPTPAPVPAGVVPQTLSLDVTGAPVADTAFLDAQIRAALDREIRPTLRPGASIRYGPIVPWPILPLPSGTRAAVNVTVTLVGDGVDTTVTGITTVVLNGVVVPATEPTLLFLSDDPEYLQSEGLIFRGTVTAERPARLYYYHSDIGLPHDLDLVLTATVPSRVQLTASDAGPDLDVMSVGHIVTRDFLRFRQNNEGVVVDLVPGKPFVVRHGLLLQGELIAGALDAHVVGGGPVAVSVVSTSPGSRPEAFLAGPRVAFDGHRRHGTFDLAGYGAITRTYTVGGPPTSVQYGGRVPTPRNITPNDDGRDFGDYGVTQRITMTLTNSTDDPHVVYFYEKPLGGPVRSTFIVDGQFKELGCARIAQQYWITTYQLAPHSAGASTTVTMTDGGSYYPIEFGVTETQPLPYTPPLGSPDGCSPIASPFPNSPTTSTKTNAHR